ncbi:MAG: CHASE2 domain-containing protein [Bacteroidia bacterium]|nr:CHASE2 domain-containing protein [Bacteroidia bacterium]
MNLPALLGWTFRLALVSALALLIDSYLPAREWSWRIQDLIYRRLPQSPPDTQIVIVDIAQLERPRLASLLLKLGEAQPSFIGIDAVFQAPFRIQDDSLWQAALCTVAQKLPVCLVSTLDLSYPMEQAPQVPISHPLFTGCVEQAFANLILYDTTARIVREYQLYTVSGKDTAFSLGLRAALAADPALLDTLSFLPSRFHIRYRGGLSHFYFVSGEEVLQENIPLGWLRGRILLLGLADPLYRTMEDIFFSPLNEAFLRRSFPDMYGVLIHANVAAMLLHRSFFKEVSLLWVLGLLGTTYLLISIPGFFLRPGIGRSALVRTLQIGLLWAAIELTIYLGTQGWWLEVEPVLWAVLIGGEVDLWRIAPPRPLA